ncbi:crossover junction endonuclease MUS81 [Xiphophorus maculatus]|uniref:Crossover junction endonuclease MUS81 n=1 Tax=Xiphophorus maculatus TaxID=8083 RepID=M4A614_XIPMA|nr:crossover junction endonuclease MUS81 [Xiphophorus maculatus]XP_023201626.1 crossover junction endonuclease MUS81 [Xiphophorus maculatus]
MPGSEPVRFGRKRALPPCPNPLFFQWLTELRDEAKEKGLKIQYTYQKAIDSLNKYPLPLKNAKEAKILKNFGDGICKILDDKLQRHYRQNGPNASIHSLPKGAPPPGRTYNNNNSSNTLAPSRKRNDAGKDRGEDGGTKKKKKKRAYVPLQRSGGYAVLLALYRQQQIPGSKGYMFKMELQSEAQPLCDKSFSVPDLGSKYTAWSSVSTLIQKNLLIKTHNPARYSLTDEGFALAERLESVEKERRNVPVEERRGAAGPEDEEDDAVVDLTASDDEEERESLPERATGETQSSGDAGRLSLPGKTQVTMTTSRKPNRDYLLPGTYDVVLCVDFIETTGGSHYRKQELVRELQRNGVGFDVRKLNVGDFLWVAREKVAPVPGRLRAPAARELVLDYIIERKRMDDLCGSIIDGRFREQKFRLKRCGLRRPIYLVEGSSSSAAHLSLPEATLQQAIVNTQVLDGFFVKRVQDVRESAAYLTVMTRYLSKLYQNQTLVCRSRELEGDVPSDEEESGNPSCSLISFAEFNHGAVKNKCQTVREVFARQLMQISGLSGHKAAAILEQYGTPHSLLAAYEKCGSESEKEKLLSCIRYGKLKRNLGPALSRTVYQLYCTPGALT